MLCQKCNAQNQNDAVFCTKCGARLFDENYNSEEAGLTKDDDSKTDYSNSKNVFTSSSWTCPICSRENKGSDEICTKCLTPKPLDKSKNKLLFVNSTVKVSLIILFVIFAIFIIYAFSLMFSSENDDKDANATLQSTTTTPITIRTTTTAPKTTTTTTTKSETELKILAQKERAEYISDCTEISYNDLARSPDKYIGEKLKITVEIQQVLSNGFSSNAYRCYEDYDIHSGDSYLDKEWYVEYSLNDDESRILENDIITFYGTYDGTSKLERALTGVTDYVPTLQAKYCELNTNTSTAPVTTTKPKTSLKKTTTTKPKKTLYNPSGVNGWSANGTGDYVAQGLIVDHYGVLSISHDGSHYFSVKAHNNETGDYESLVSEIGSYNGTVLIPESGNYDVEISADGNWSINSYAVGTTNGSSFNGHGDAVTSVFLTTNQNWKITNNNSDSYFSVKVHYTEDEGDYDTLVSEIGNYSGVVRSDDSGSMFFEIISDGDWSISPAN